MKRLLCTVLILLLMVGCVPKEESYDKYKYSFIDTFDTVIQIVGYVQKEKDFDRYLAHAHERFRYLHKLFDVYHTYGGMNNIKTINDNAGIAPVTVDPLLLDLLEFSKEWYDKTDGVVNVAFGPVLNIWHNYRELYKGGAEGELPSMQELQQANEKTSIDKLIIDRQDGTVFLAETGMSLNLGAMAKGYATELIGQELYEMGFHSFMISSGGNVRIFDAPPFPDIHAWGIGIQDPHQNPSDPNSTSLDTAFVTDTSVVSSGNYVRYYMVDGQKIHHVIDPKTLMPANTYAAVTVITPHSAVADIASTALYILEPEEAKAFAKQHQIEALWVYEDGTMDMTDGIIPFLKKAGGATSQKERNKNEIVE